MMQDAPSDATGGRTLDAVPGRDIESGKKKPQTRSRTLSDAERDVSEDASPSLQGDAPRSGVLPAVKAAPAKYGGGRGHRPAPEPAQRHADISIRILNHHGQGGVANAKSEKARTSEDP
jgi:hypothetical protein